jgi:predicted transcriptional regulator
MNKRDMEDYERTGMIDSMQCKRDEPTKYVPPPCGTKWRIFRTIGMLPLEANDKAVLALIVDHANPVTGRADPGQLRIARLLGLSIRTVKRSIKRLLKTGYLTRRLRGLSSTAYQVHWAAILRHDGAYDAAKRCQTCHLDGDRAVPFEVSELSPKNEKGKRKEKTKHEMAPSAEGASLDTYQNGFQEDARGDLSTNPNPPAEPIGHKFWSERRDWASDALKSETDPERRNELEAIVARARDHLRRVR